MCTIPAIALKLAAFVFLAVSNITHATDALEIAQILANEPVGESEGSAHILESDKQVGSSEEWNQLLQNDTLGCSAAVPDSYVWRVAGYGSNVNYLLLAWANAILEGREDVGIVVNTEKLFPRTTCLLPSNGEETRRGWHCIFAPMPHLCSFDDREGWDEYNTLRRLSPAERREASGKGRVIYLRTRIESMAQSAERAGSGIFELLAMLYEHLTSHHQPWFKADVEAILAEPDIAAVRAGNYVSMHIRRTDKQIFDRDPFTATEEYFKRAVDYLSNSTALGGLDATDITGLWLSTDDDVVFEEVKSLAPQYFPGVKNESVVFVTSRVPVRLLNPATFVDGAVDRNTYEAIVLLRAEMLMLAGADVFSGTFSSNLGRIVALMRETLGKPRDSALSSDTEDWFAGRL